MSSARLFLGAQKHKLCPTSHHPFFVRRSLSQSLLIHQIRNTMSSSTNQTVALVLKDEKLKHYVCPEKVPVCKLEVQTAFDLLTKEEKLYAHYFARACWAGAPIVLQQVSKESPKIFNFLVAFFSDASVVKACSDSTNEQVLQQFKIYASLFFGNMGNYTSFGDSKFIPRCESSDLESIVLQTKNDKLIQLWNGVKHDLYSLTKRELDFGNSTYYNDEVTQADAEKVQEFLNANNISAYNTRLFKTGDNSFELRLASGEQSEPVEHQFKGVTIRIVQGDYAKYMQQIVSNLRKALPYANEVQTKMIEKYIEHFSGGNVEDHKESQKWWIKDRSPAVETNIGFIESYRDPLRVRGEYEGFVAVVNKEMSKKFNELVDSAQELLKELPWNKRFSDGTQPFEIENFSKPDFTALEILAFASSGLPAGINIPNYEDIREHIGFKNVSLSNVLSATSPMEEITMLKKEDIPLFKQMKGKAFEVQVGIHELLGHGSGKAIVADKNGELPLDLSKVINPLTGKADISTYYKHGETFNAMFGEISNSYEECRAESVGIYLSTYDHILKIFGHEGNEAREIVYINWLLMVRAGLLGLEFYNPDSKKWLQAHMRARYCILNVLLEAGEDFVQIVEEDGNCYVTLDKSKIQTVGMKAMETFLLKLGIYKSTCNLADGVSMYHKYTEVDDRFLRLRKIVLEKKQPRRVFVQPLTIEDGENVKLQEFEPSYEGMIECFSKITTTLD